MKLSTNTDASGYYCYYRGVLVMLPEYLLYMCSSHFYILHTESSLLNNNVSEMKLFERVVCATGGKAGAK